MDAATAATLTKRAEQFKTKDVSDEMRSDIEWFWHDWLEEAGKTPECWTKDFGTLVEIGLTDKAAEKLVDYVLWALVDGWIENEHPGLETIFAHINVLDEASNREAFKNHPWLADVISGTEKYNDLFQVIGHSKYKDLTGELNYLSMCLNWHDLEWTGEKDGTVYLVIRVGGEEEYLQSFLETLDDYRKADRGEGNPDWLEERGCILTRRVKFGKIDNFGNQWTVEVLTVDCN